MAISKVTLNGTTLMDATTATAAAGDVISPKTAMLKNGVVTTGTGSGGITPTGTKQISITSNGTTTEDVINYASAEISVNVSGGGGTDYAAEICNGTITRFDDDLVTDIKTQLFRGYNFSSVVIFLKNCKTLSASYCFGGAGITTLCLPSFENFSNVGYFVSGANSLTAIDLGENFSTDAFGIKSNVFNGAPALATLILRKSTAIIPLQNVNGFNGTPFKSGGAGGTIYIPKVLFDHLGDNSSLDYKAATNWSTVNGYGTITWAKIEGSQYENAYADGTSIT